MRFSLKLYILCLSFSLCGCSYNQIQHQPYGVVRQYNSNCYINASLYGNVNINCNLDNY